jgi:hypothetical protein
MYVCKGAMMKNCRDTAYDVCDGLEACVYASYLAVLCKVDCAAALV